MRKRLFVKFLVIFLFAFIFSVAVQNFFHIELSNLEILVKSFGILAPVAYSLILFLGLSVPFNPISDYLTVNLAAFLFPPLVAITGTFIAHTLALGANYWIARRFGWKILSRLLSGEEGNYLADLAEKIRPSQIFWLRWLLPLTAVGIDFISYAAGLANLNFLRFYLVSIIPWTIINTLFFSSTNFVIDRATILFFIPGIIIVATPLVVLYLSKQTAHIKSRNFVGTLIRKVTRK